LVNPSWSYKKVRQETALALKKAKAKGERRQNSVYKHFVNWYVTKYSKHFGSTPFNVYNNTGSHAGPDILVTKNGKPWTVTEVTNYKRTTNMTNKRFLRYIANLSRFKCYRLLVLSFPDNLQYANYSYHKNLIQPKSQKDRIQLAENCLKQHHIDFIYCMFTTP
jgi:hypothetical protein